MNLYSRLTGEYLSIKSDMMLPSGLYALMDKRDPSNQMLLLDNGTAKHHSDVFSCSFNTMSEKQTGDKKRDYIAALAIIRDSIEFINRKYRYAELTEFSHMLPPEIVNSIAHSDLDNSIMLTLDNGVFHAINQSPRMSMRYDVELLATSRVKRYASNYQTHLVAHSQCWQQRTFTGIIPKKLLAKVSEDEVIIYENMVYARLIDHLLQYLANAQARLQKILDIIDKFNKLDAKDSVHHYVTQITNDWGRAFNDSDIDSLKKNSQQQMDFVSKYTAKLVQIKNSELYRSIPKRIQVNIELNATNILSHDDNYRRIAALWRTWSKHSTKERLNPSQILLIKQEQQQQYIDYLQVIIQQIFNDIGWQFNLQNNILDIGKGLFISVDNQESGIWKLIHNKTVICRVVASSEPVSDSYFEAGSLQNNHQSTPTVLVTPQFISTEYRQEVIELSPLSLHGKEALASALVKNIWRWVLSLFKQSLPAKLPTLIERELADNQQMFMPLTTDQLNRITTIANSCLAESISNKNSASRFIRCCPYCRMEANERSFTLDNHSNGYFSGKCRNKDCQSVWVHDPKQQSYFVLNDGGNCDGRYSFLISDH